METSIKVITIATAFLLILSCKTPSAKVVEGTYTGTMTVNAVPAGSATTVITQMTDNEVGVEINYGLSPLNLASVAVAGEANPYDLTYSDSNADFYGHVDGNQLIFTIYYDGGTNQATFTGNK